MTEKLSRRNFFKLLGGGVAAAVAAPYVVAEAVKKVTVEYGWTWYIPKNQVEPELLKKVTNMLRTNQYKIIDNLFENSSLYAKLDTGEKVLLEIKHISPEDQTQRMKVRMQQRLEEQQKRLIDHKPHNGGRLYPAPRLNDEAYTFYEGYNDLDKYGVS